MLRELLEYTASRTSLLWLVVLLCVLLLAWTEFMCFLPYFFSV